MLRRVLPVVLVVVLSAAIGACGGGGKSLKTTGDFTRYVGDVFQGKSAYGVEVADDAKSPVKLGVADTKQSFGTFKGVVDMAPDVACPIAGAVEKATKPDVTDPAATIKLAPSSVDLILEKAHDDGLPAVESKTALDALLEMTPYTLAATADAACKARDSGL